MKFALFNSHFHFPVPAYTFTCVFNSLLRQFLITNQNYNIIGPFSSLTINEYKCFIIIIIIERIVQATPNDEQVIAYFSFDCQQLIALSITQIQPRRFALPFQSSFVQIVIFPKTYSTASSDSNYNHFNHFEIYENRDDHHK